MGPPTAPPAGDAPASPEADDGQVEKDLDALLADVQRERDEYLELAKRTKADFENFRKRIAADLEAASNRGKADLARELIDPLDNLERALAAAGIDAEAEDPLGDGNSSEEKGGDSLAHGVLLVFHGLRETLRRHGIESLNPKGEKFDPQMHEALSTQPGDGVEPGTVVEVMQKGYLVGEQLVRPARVVVAE
ncbi:MAG TPA: nucleotide exchange factor GrpE [Solirubrobacterales bacterium]